MVDTKCNFPNGKCKKTEANASIDADAGTEDESLLRQPLRTSSAGFSEAKKAFENGTDEVRRLLMQECSIIYECNVCRNMFRSLANFISHKRSYCKMSTSESFHFFPDRNSSVIIQTVERSEPCLLKSRSTGSSPIPSRKSSSRDLSKVIERLKRVEVSSELSDKTLALTQSQVKQPVQEVKVHDPILELERVSTTANAVYQTLKTQKNTDSIKTEVDEVHHLLMNQKTFLGPDGKAVMNNALKSFNVATTANGNSNQIEMNFTPVELLNGIFCEICKMAFQTEKTLKMHMQKKHSSTTYVFQCPTCSMTFLQPAAVIRHLANEHKKPLRRIRKMRDTILKKRIQIGDVQVKGPSRELKRLNLNNTKDPDNSNMTEQLNEKPVTSCTYCWKKFERRAVLATHLTNCLVRKSSLKNLELSKQKSISIEQVNEIKSQKLISNHCVEPNNLNTEIKIKEQKETEVKIKQEPLDEENSLTSPSNINALFENLENQSFGSGLQTVSLEKLEMMVGLTENTVKENKEVKNDRENENNIEKNHENNIEKDHENNIEKNKLVNVDKGRKKEKTKRFRIIPSSKQLTCRCKICNKQFNALSNLRRHISMFHYRSRRFGCNLCDYRAFRRYDIVNHLTFVHKMTGERENMAIEYVTVHEIKYSKDDVEGDIVVVNEEETPAEPNFPQEQLQNVSKPQVLAKTETPKTYDKREKDINVHLQSNNPLLDPYKEDKIILKDATHVKVVRRKLKKSLEQQVEGKRRPIRNRIKTVNKDFVYDLLSIKEDTKQTPRPALKRRNTIFADQKTVSSNDLTQLPIKITPYRLRTEPLVPADKRMIKGAAANMCRNIIHEALAAPSTLPELPAERPQMRSRLISSSRSDSNAVPIIETTELEAAGLKSTFFDDSFLEKFAKKSNPSFRMKPLLALQHSPLNSILQKFDTTLQNIQSKECGDFIQPPSKVNISPSNYTTCLLPAPEEPVFIEQDVTPNGKQISEHSSPPATPKKRITLMQRLAENRAKRRDTFIRTALEN